MFSFYLLAWNFFCTFATAIKEASVHSLEVAITKLINLNKNNMQEKNNKFTKSTSQELELNLDGSIEQTFTFRR